MKNTMHITPEKQKASASYVTVARLISSNYPSQKWRLTKATEEGRIV
jgi:hypothetical protein